MPLHDTQPLHQQSVPDAFVVRHHLQAGLLPTVLCWVVHALVLHGLCYLGHHHHHDLLELHAKQVEYNTL